MSREYKFRAWDKESNTWLEAVTYILHSSGRLLTTPRNVELTEWTGFTDKHGKDIYEGDIIKADWHWEKPHAVKWPEDYYAYIEYGLSESEQHLEIIGNVYENGDLLK